MEGVLFVLCFLFAIEISVTGTNDFILPHCTCTSLFLFGNDSKVPLFINLFIYISIPTFSWFTFKLLEDELLILLEETFFIESVNLFL